MNGKNINLKSLDLPDSEQTSITRSHELEELNARLNDLVEQQRKRLNEIVAANNKHIATIANDLRSPFVSILDSLEILKQNLSDNPEFESYIDMAVDSANTAINLLDNLLAWILSKNKENNFNPVKTNLYELLEYEVATVKASVAQKQLTLGHSIVPQLLVRADREMVKTILRNLINNAIKFTPRGGKINVSATEWEQFVEVVVTDNGIGMSLEAQNSLFTTGMIHSTPGTNNEQGTGIGLLLCKEFVELHGGNIRIESEPDNGSKFKFTLPHYVNQS